MAGLTSSFSSSSSSSSSSPSSPFSSSFHHVNAHPPGVDAEAGAVLVEIELHRWVIARLDEEGNFVVR